jgi:hypothetical protein
MISHKRLFLIYPLMSLFILFAIALALYLLNPFSNACEKGDCNNGYGIYRYGSGMTYEGEWMNGKRHGRGTLISPDGTKYSGDWQHNRMHGNGTKTYASDTHLRKYAGEWKNGNKHGKGTATYLVGSSYEGFWRNGEIHGHGTYTMVDGRKLTGPFNHGLLEGTVKEMYPDGRVLVVEMRNGMKQGPGVMTSPDGTEIRGTWINNKLVGSLEYYLFRGNEFEKGYSIEHLSRSIKADIGLNLNADEETIPWLNELLKITNLYEQFSTKIQKAGSSREIDALIDSLKPYRREKFSDLDTDSQKKTVKLNRLLIERLYPYRTPPIAASSPDKT